MKVFSPQRVLYGIANSQFIDIYGDANMCPDDKKPIVVLLHGGFWKGKYDLNLMNSMAENLVAQGCIVANVEYPRIDNDSHPKAETIISSVRTACEFVDDEYNLNKKRKMIVMGHSAGGYLALMMGTEKFGKPDIIDKIIAQASITDLWAGQEAGLSDNHDAIKNFVGSSFDIVNKARYDVLSPVTHLLKENKPTIFLVHGDMDEDVPLVQSRILYDQYNSNNMHLVHLKSTDHYGIIDPTHPSWNTQFNMIMS